MKAKKTTNKWIFDEGMESPAWYNIRITNKNAKAKIRELILSNSSSKFEGTSHKDSEWTLGYYDQDFQPTGNQLTFPNKTLALKSAKEFIKRKSKRRKK